jgi:hypothetical protein
MEVETRITNKKIYNSAMKYYGSYEENTWFEYLNTDLTQELMLLQQLKVEQNHDEIKNIMAEIKAKKEGPVDAGKTQILNDIYASKKPELKEGDNYSYISMDISEDGGNYWGILNYRIDGNHRQFRF